MVEPEELIDDYWPFESRKSIVKNMWDASKDVNTSMMGVSSMGGVGKNMFVKEVGRKAMEDLFVERRKPGHVQYRNFSSHNAEDELPLIEQEGIYSKIMCGGFLIAEIATYFGYLHHGDDWNMQHTVSLLKSSCKQMGAHILARYATDEFSL
ncbi:hypothetical protein Pint_21586 [Pistacia integerrima]|uniref:Uncharacterized protein n=1 Tax=Pistacia integerrima TaxID=434235 RepID=A0ACC0XCV1_9ROSI|nr:hypothetical protein Pint_21586 [Pistacia integerrima]